VQRQILAIATLATIVSSTALAFNPQPDPPGRHGSQVNQAVFPSGPCHADRDVHTGLATGKRNALNVGGSAGSGGEISVGGGGGGKPDGCVAGQHPGQH